MRSPEGSAGISAVSGAASVGWAPLIAQAPHPATDVGAGARLVAAATCSNYFVFVNNMVELL